MTSPLLSIHGDGTGEFAAWLKKLGLQDDFLKSYPLSKLVEWKWLVPQFRVAFPESFFVNDWPGYPELPADKKVGIDPVSDAYGLLWDSTWFGDSEDKALWFLHPFFRPGDPAGSLLHEHQISSSILPTVVSFQHPNGHAVEPFVDYYFHWQGYALIDVIRTADCFRPVLLNTPDATERARRLVGLTESTQWNVSGILTNANRWGGLAKPMTWLSHYRAFRNVSDEFEFRHGVQPGRRKRGAAALASHLEITPERLERAIKDQFLVLAQNWKWATERKCRWVGPAWETLRTDIFFAVEWLCLLTGKMLDDYLDLWQYTHIGQESWATLKSVLPFEYYTDREYFLRQAPFYLSDFNKRLPKKNRFEDGRLRAAVKRISAKNRHFNSFLSSFRKLHEELAPKPVQPGGIDFRNRSPLDYYLLLAIRAETCFRAELKACGKLAHIEPKEQGLGTYMLSLAKQAGLDNKAIGCFATNCSATSNLVDEPEALIASIWALVGTTGCSQGPIGQAMLYCLVGRNYFAHHDYLDTELLNEKSSQFLLGGVLLAVLTLLNGDLANP